MPRLEREVPSVRIVVPVKVEGRGVALDVLEVADVLEALELDDDEAFAADPLVEDDAEPPFSDCNTCSTMLEI